jgi:pimeloyl-ACP methyl ester carboxylesterase
MDTSYILYTTTVGLPSNNITGVVIDKGGSVWVSTGAGIARLVSADLTVFNVPFAPKGNELAATKRTLLACAKASDFNRDCNFDPLEIHVAADSSTSTVLVYTGDNPMNKVVYIGQRQAGASNYEDQSFSPQYGALTLQKPRSQITDSLVVLFKHPNYVEGGTNTKYVSYDLFIRDTVINVLTFKAELRVYHPPVMFVHGIWSSIGSFEKMEKHILDNSNNYENYQLLRIWYPTAEHEEPYNSSEFYKNKVPAGIEQLIDNCARNKLSAGKVNIVGHSRGGIFSRLYLQEQFVTYRNDINKLITVNTPHMGSHAANLILDKRKLLGVFELGNIMQNAGMLDDIDDPRGAKELKVNDDAIRVLLNGPNLNKNTVPTHAITGIYKFGIGKADLLKSVVVNGATRIPYVGNVVLFLRLYALSLGTLCVEGPIDNCMKEIFNGEDNDIVVPISSQKGGLPANAISVYSDKVAHSNKHKAVAGATLVDAVSVLEQVIPQNRVIELLRKNPDTDPAFTRAGYAPTQLNYNFLPGLPGDADNGRNTNATLAIDPAILGTTRQFGDTLQVAVTGSADVQYILLEYKCKAIREASSDVEKLSTFTFPYPIPRDAIGQVKIKAYGFDANGLVAIDSSFINIGLPPAVVLDSIKITNGDYITIQKSDSVIINVLGYYNDTVRNVTYMPGMSYALSEAKAAPAKFGIRGVTEGYDRLTVGFGGKTATASVEVTANNNGPILPVLLGTFTARYANKAVWLNWTTASEQNNDYFEIQRSTDGLNFEPIGVMAGNGTTTLPSRYEFRDPAPKPGRNFYRLKQVNFDRVSAYSGVVVVRIDESRERSISIYPNPATDRINIQISSNAGKGWQMRLVNMTGQFLMQRTIPENTATISMPLPRLARGVYLVEIVKETGERAFADKLIIQ